MLYEKSYKIHPALFIPTTIFEKSPKLIRLPAVKPFHVGEIGLAVPVMTPLKKR